MKIAIATAIQRWLNSYLDFGLLMGVAVRIVERMRSICLVLMLSMSRIGRRLTGEFREHTSSALWRSCACIRCQRVRALCAKAANRRKDQHHKHSTAMLRYKCDDAGVWFEEVNEAYSTQTCSCCQSRTGPKGVAGLGIREWAGEECGAYHHRDINAAINILAVGRGRLAGGIPALSA
jgi:hypothetical protein